MVRGHLRNLTVIVAVAAIGLAGSAVVAQASPTPLNWGQLTSAGAPPTREFASMAYDSSRGETVLFGGGNATTNFSDTWVFNGSSWAQRFPIPSPPNEIGAGMVFDSARNVVVMFGGTLSNSDVWEWNGLAQTWTQKTLTPAPPPRVWTAMAYDPVHSQTVLFGGDASGGVDLGDTWVYDGSTWTKKAPAGAPPARQGESMAVDPNLNEVVLFGGRSAGQRMADTWAWNGTTWTQLATTASPFPRFWSSMAYDSQVGHLVLFGGDHIEPFGLGPINDTWELDGTQWAQDWTAGAPSVRAGQTVAPDANGRIVLFGGTDEGYPGVFYNDTWELGTGIVTPPGTPAFTFYPTSVDFGTATVGITTGAANVNVTNSGTGPLVGPISTTGDFAVASTDCPSAPNPFAAGYYCKVFVTFTPTLAGDRYGSLVFTDTATGGSWSLALHGVGAVGDFTISASPASLGLLQGSSGTTSISTTVIGAAGTIALSATSTDPGLTVTFNPTSITSGGGSTATINVAPTVPTGPQAITVWATEGTVTHSAGVSVNVLAIPDFSISASPASLSMVQGSSASSLISTAAINAVGPINLSAASAPSGLTMVLTATTVSAGGTSTLTVGSAYVTPAESYTVTITGTEGSMSHSTTVAITVTPKGIDNGGFETGDFSGWTTTGNASIVKSSHSGKYSAKIGPGQRSTTNALAQTFTVPASGKLSYWYRMTCGSDKKSDWFAVTLLDGATGVTSTLQPRVCTENGGWKQVTVSLSLHAGHSVTVTFQNHIGANPDDPTFTLVDDVALT